MVLFSRPVVAALACAGAVTGAGASSVFVVPPAAGPYAPALSRGSAEAQFADFAAFESQPEAQPSTDGFGFLRWLAAGAAAGLMLAVSSAPAEAYPGPLIVTEDAIIENLQPRIDYNITFEGVKKFSQLELCKNNKKYHKRTKDDVFKMEKRMNKYSEGSIIYNRLKKKVERIKYLDEAYGGRYCGKEDGLPRVIATGENVRGGIVLPGLMFLYIAGWIGWAGRSYLIRTQSKEKELFIDVPLALTCMASGFSWPVAAWQEIVNGEMVAKAEDVHVSCWN